jgi:DnaJ-class molecular chaperone
MDTDLYQLLGIARTADADAIKKAYRKLAKELHPDRNPGDKAAENRFKQVSAAYEVLSDPKKRALYDEFGMSGLQAGFDPAQARAWGAGGFGGGTRGRRPRNEAVGYTGFQGGSGGFGGFGGDGAGFGFDDLIDQLFGRGGFSAGGSGGGRGGGVRARAQARGADAEVAISLDFNQAARGDEVPLRLNLNGEERALKLKIPPGVADGTKLRLKGQGATGAGGSGDLYVTVHVADSPVYRREPHEGPDGASGTDALVTTIEVPVPTAILGGKVQVPTPYGPVTATVPPGTQGGTRLRLAGKGIRGGGDLYAEVSLVLPETIDDEVRAVAKTLEAKY